jgi:phytoene dehydrogenase-like protein
MLSNPAVIQRSPSLDAVVVGSGPNGLAAAALLASSGCSVHVVEAHAELGGGTRTAELTLPGFLHDVCSAVHPLGELSPYFRTLPLEQHGLCWAHPPLSVAHPLDGEPAVLLRRSVQDTAEGLGSDGRAWQRLMDPFVRLGAPFLEDLLGPLRIPSRPLSMARFGLYGFRSAVGLTRGLFEEQRARAVFAGCAAHAILPLDMWMTGAVGLLFSLTTHLCDWPMAIGGSASISRALESYIRAHGGTFETNKRIESLADLPESRVVLFDLAPRQLISIAGDALPSGYLKRLARYDYGPGVFKIDWALSGPIPWKDPECARASTVHVGGAVEEIAASERAAYMGEHSERPFVLVTQQSHFDPSRAPEGKHTGYAYCHVPFGSTVDMTARIEAQIERFAPGFGDVILARATHSPADLERYNSSFIGGVIAGGASHIGQLFTRPVARLDPYSTPNRRLFLCSAATPPGGGVHGMCGYFAAKSALKRLRA